MNTVVPWDAAWQEALYGPGGFYRRAEGPAGHFATSVTGVPHATSVMARAVVALARRHGLHTVVDVGAGRGDFIRAVHRYAPEVRCVGVDIVDRPVDMPEDIRWWRSPGGAGLSAQLQDLRGTLVLAHEWLDVVPTTLASKDQVGVWRQHLVDTADGSQHVGDPVPGVERAWLERWVDDPVQTAEVGLSRDRAFADLVSRVEHGVIVAVDYGHRRAERPPHGTLTGYRCGRAVYPVPDGSMDLTAHVAIDSLESAARSCLVPQARLSCHRQHEVLRDLLGVPTMPNHALARSQPRAYLEALAEHNADRVLREHGGFGDFWWVIAKRDDKLVR